MTRTTGPFDDVVVRRHVIVVVLVLFALWLPAGAIDGSDSRPRVPQTDSTADTERSSPSKALHREACLVSAASGWSQIRHADNARITGTCPSGLTLTRISDSHDDACFRLYIPPPRRGFPLLI